MIGKINHAVETDQVVSGPRLCLPEPDPAKRQWLRVAALVRLA
jgi:hypothetical protein